MEQWEYKIKEFTTWHRIGKTKDGGVGEIIGFEIFKQIEVEGFFGKKRKEEEGVALTTEEMEITFNDLGKQGWELCGIVPLIITSSIGPGSNTDRAYFIFKRQIKN